jgi:hypothetical protein
MPLYTYNNSLLVRARGLAASEIYCCGSCDWPRFLNVTISGVPNGYTVRSVNSAQPPPGGGFAPECDDVDLTPQVLFGGVSSRPAGWGSYKMDDMNGTFTAEFSPDGCNCLSWGGFIPVTYRGSGPDLETGACLTALASMSIRMCRLTPVITLTISPPSDPAGSTATGEVTGVTAGALSAVSVTNGGSGYAAFEVVRVEPAMAVDVYTSTGSGAEFSVVMSEGVDSNGDPAWSASSITVTDPGAGYSFGDFASLYTTDGIAGDFSSIQLRLTRIEPTVTVSVTSTGGSGAELEVTLTETTDWNGEAVWQVASVTVINGGTGYDSSDSLTFVVTEGSELPFGAYATLSVTGGVIDGVYIWDGGLYAHTDGTIAGVQILEGGYFWKEETTSNVVVDEPAVIITSNNGDGGQIEAVIDDDPNSATFGQVVGLTIVNGGSSYVLNDPFWELSFSIAFTPIGGTLFPLSGPTRGLHEGPPVSDVFFSDGVDLSGHEGPLGDRLAFQSCGMELLNKSYNAYYAAVPSGYAMGNNGAIFNYGGPGPSGPIANVWLRAVDLGEGQLTVAISPA